MVFTWSTRSTSPFQGVKASLHGCMDKGIKGIKYGALTWLRREYQMLADATFQWVTHGFTPT